MEVEEKQVEVLEQFCLLAKGAKGRTLAQIIKDATSHPSLFAFGELLDVPSIAQLQDTELGPHWELLRIFAYGTWTDFKEVPSSKSPPELTPQQVLKLKQLTLVSLAQAHKTLPYDTLMRELDITNIRELEDLIINDCIYARILRGKMDQRNRVLEVHFAIGRDLRPSDLPALVASVGVWVSTTEQLMRSIEDKISWAGKVSEDNAVHKKSVQARIEDVRKAIKMEQESRGGSDIGFVDGVAAMDYAEEERPVPGRPKRRR